MTDLSCLSCKKKVVNDQGNTQFLCPGCSKYPVVRCTNCRAKAAQYSCPQCGFTGPN
ncbi:MAG TPA: zinc finger domain-containing protein [Candidatus Nanoarchaeia archaeon]|nr:zinc finger domain-containing protein [Candidatus Nanoarchaeia archaeon]